MTDVSEHPRWNELVTLCDKIERLQREAHNLRELIDKESIEKPSPRRERRNNENHNKYNR